MKDKENARNKATNRGAGSRCESAKQESGARAVRSSNYGTNSNSSSSSDRGSNENAESKSKSECRDSRR